MSWNQTFLQTQQESRTELGTTGQAKQLYLKYFSINFQTLPWSGQLWGTCGVGDGCRRLCRPGAWPWLRTSPRTCPCPWWCRACGAPSHDHVSARLQHDTALVRGEWSSSVWPACIQPRSAGWWTTTSSCTRPGGEIFYKIVTIQVQVRVIPSPKSKSRVQVKFKSNSKSRIQV